MEGWERGYYLSHKIIKKEWVPIYAQTNDHTAQLAGAPSLHFYTEASLFIDSQIAVQSYYDFDVLTFSNDVYNIEAEALGVKLVYSDQMIPAVDNREPLLKEPTDLKKLNTPDFFRDGRFPYQIEIFRQKKDLGINQATFCGPFSLAVALRGYSLLVQDIQNDPIFYRDLMQFIVEKVTMPYIETVNKHLGITQFRGSDAWAIVPVLSPVMMEDLVLPWNLDIVKKGSDIGVNSYVYSPGFFGNDQSEHFDDSIMRRCFDFSIASMGGIDPYLRFGRNPDYSLAPFLQYALAHKDKYPKDPFRIEVRIDSKVLRDGPVEKIIQHIKTILDTFCSNFPVSILLSNISIDTPPEHIHAAVQSTHYYGKLPYEFIDDDGAFKPNEHESYLDFISRMESL